MFIHPQIVQNQDIIYHQAIRARRLEQSAILQLAGNQDFR
jgi:hypothetical protein